jgi:Acyltransferase
MAKDPEVLALARLLVGDIVGGFGLPRTEFFRALFWTLFRVPMVRFATIGLTFDRLVAEGGFPKASQWALTNWCRRVMAHGAENIPAEGPLLIVANHPGTYDALIVFSRVGRPDIRWISTEIPFLDKMPHVHDHVIFTSKRNALRRMSTMRAAIRHLRAGGALLYIGAGFIEPDPAVYPGAAEHIEGWLTGIDFFFHHVPGLRIMPAIVSGVISPRWARSPLAWLRRKDVDKRRLVGFAQVLTQLFFPGRLMFTPSVSFGPPVTIETLRSESGQENILPAVIARAKALLAEHIREFGGRLT